MIKVQVKDYVMLCMFIRNKIQTRHKTLMTFGKLGVQKR